MKDQSELKIAIVCDWLTGIGGAERVLLELHRMFPKAPIFTSQYDPTSISGFENADVRTSWLNKLPKSLRKFLPVLRAISFSSLKLNDYDLVISASGAEAKGLHLPNTTLHINYCHSPTHYYWIRYEEYIKNPGFGKFNWLARFGLRVLVLPMRQWDYRAAQRPDIMIANSRFTKDNIKKYYGRESSVIYPPVDIKRFTQLVENKKLQRKGFVTAGRQTPYLRKDLAVDACSQLNMQLTVIGNGPEHAKLLKRAGPSVTFLTNVSDKEIPKYFQSAKAFIMPGMEDFGIVAVEAMAAGTPVIAYHGGGALEYVLPGKTGEFFDDQTVESVIKTLEKFQANKYDNMACQKHAMKFSTTHFQKGIEAIIKESALSS